MSNPSSTKQDSRNNGLKDNSTGHVPESFYVLDDDQLVGQTLARLVESNGMVARVFTDTTRFFHTLESESPDYIAIDLFMPDMDGLEVIRKLANLHCKARIIIASGANDRVVHAASLAAEEQGLQLAGELAKPYDITSLRYLLQVSDHQYQTRTTKQTHQADTVSLRDIETAIHSGQLVLHYQPKIDCRSRDIRGFETLVRWNHPSLGLLGPDRFLPFVEDSELMEPLTHYVFSTALSWYADNAAVWDHCGDDVHISVNISARSLRNANFSETLFHYCAKAKVPTSRVVLELTETSAMDEPTISLELLTRLRMRGFLLSIDDFGTGYSSLAQLVRLPFSEIKIDRSFVNNSMRSRESRTAVRSIVELGKSLGMQTTAEGIEDAATLAFVTAIGCDVAQGFHIAKPMAENEILAWIAERASRDMHEPRKDVEDHSNGSATRSLSTFGNPNFFDIAPLSRLESHSPATDFLPQSKYDRVSSCTRFEDEDDVSWLDGRLKSIVDSMNTSFLITNPSLQVTFVNQDFIRLIGNTESPFAGKQLAEVIPLNPVCRLLNNLKACREDGSSIEFEEYLEPLSIWVSGEAHKILGGFAIYFRDTTQAHASTQNLRLLEAAASRINDVLLITDCNTIEAPAGPRIVYVNEAFVRITGYKREEVLGKTPRILQGALSDRKELDRIRRALETFTPIRSEIINYTKSGDPLWFELDIVPLTGESGRYSHFVSVQRDITQRKEAEERLRKSEERFQLLASATQDMVRDWDIASDTIRWNAKGERLMSLDSGGTSRLNDWTNIIHPVDRQRVQSSLKAFLAGNESIWECEYRLVEAEGVCVSIVDRGYAVRGHDAEPIRVLNSMMDVTDRNELAAHLHRSQKLEAVGQLTGGVAHDFNNLLTVILGNAELLVEKLQEQDSNGLHSLANMIVTAAHSGNEMIERLLAFSRKQPLEPQPVDVNALIADFAMLLRRSIQENIEFKVVEGGDLQLAYADTAQLEASLLNLVINARDAICGDGTITVETSNIVIKATKRHTQNDVDPYTFVKISIKDTGSGMSEYVRNRAFEPFFTTKGAKRGSGLGLSMVYGFIKQSGGHIRILSRKGRGTTVNLYLPIAPKTYTAQKSIQETTLPVSASHEHILVVEDDDLVRTHAVSVISSMGYSVHTAKSVNEALEALAMRSDIDLLFTDLILPGGIQGDRLAEIALRQKPTIKVLLTSGYLGAGHNSPGPSTSAFQVLPKPYGRRELERKLRHVLHPAEAACHT